MDKINKGDLKKYNLFLAIDIVLIVLDVLLFSFSVISLFVFLLSLIFTLLFFIIFVVLSIKSKKKKVQKVNPKLAKIIITDQDVIDLYNKAGIPIIYDEEGKIKDIFELLGLKVEYDENGNRITTIYERLKIVPRFDKSGKEIPTFLSIKNRVRGFIKPEKETGVLTRILSDEEKEELLLRQMLEQKLQESEAKGDTKKAKVIKKVIEQKKKEKEEAPKKEGYVKMSKAKPVSMQKTKAVKAKAYGFNPIQDISNLFSIGLPSITLPLPKIAPKKKDEEQKNPIGFSLKGGNLEPNKESPTQKVVVVPVPYTSLKPKNSFLKQLKRNDSISHETGLDSNVFEK